MIGGKLYDFDYSGVTKDRWGQTLNPFMKGLDVVLAQKLQRDQQEAYQQGLSELSKNQYGLQPMDEEGLAAMIASNPDLNQEDIEVITAMQGPQSGQGLAGMSAPQRRQFAITPEMQQRAVAIDYLTGSQPGTALNQLMGQYKNLVASADEKAIEDYRAERAYQDTRADKAKAEEKAERAYQDAKAKEQREIEKQRMEYVDKRLEGLQGPAFRATTETAKANVANEARNLDPERFAGKSDEEILERLKLGVEPQKKSGKDYDKEAELEALKHQFRMEENAQKAANRPTKSDEGLDFATKEEIKQEAKGIKEEKANLTKEKKLLDDSAVDIDRQTKKSIAFANRLNKDDIYKDINNASLKLGLSGYTPFAGTSEEASKSLANLKDFASELVGAFTELQKKINGVTGRQLDTEKEAERVFGSIATVSDWEKLNEMNEDRVKQILDNAVKRYINDVKLYKEALSERKSNYQENVKKMKERESNYQQYKTGKKQPIKTVSGFEIEIEEE